MLTVLEVVGVNWQLSSETTQLHAVMLGVGGKVEEARNVEFCAGNEGKVVAPALLWEGELGPVALLYWVTRRLKSSLGVTV